MYQLVMAVYTDKKKKVKYSVSLGVVHASNSA